MMITSNLPLNHQNEEFIQKIVDIFIYLPPNPL